MPPEFRDILLALNAQNARYLLVGGYAVGVYSEPRATKDLDLWIQMSAENSLAVYYALVAFGAPLSGVTPEDFNARAQTGFQIGVVPVRIDILHSLDGVRFEEAWERREHDSLDGIPVNVISREDLIENKLASGRPRDLLDIKEIRKAATYRKKDERTH
jgi:hypothetical protein